MLDQIRSSDSDNCIERGSIAKNVHVSPDSVVAALGKLANEKIGRTERSRLMSLLLLKAKEPEPGAEFELRSSGADSVEPELSRFFRIAPGSRRPDVNPFGRHDGALQYLTPGYERRGTYTHLYDNRALSSLVNAYRKEGRLFVKIPPNAFSGLAAALHSPVPLHATAAFLLRKEEFEQGSTSSTLLERFKDAFNLSDDEIGDLFDPDDRLKLNFSEKRFVDKLDSLPPDLRPHDSGASHASTLAAQELVEVTHPNDVDLVIGDDVWRRVRRAVASSKAVALVGLPGTAKSALWADLLDQAAEDPSCLGLVNSPRYVCYTAEIDWTARTLIGGHYPDQSGQLVFREGYLLAAIRENLMLWIDEMNRADLDRILGPVLTFLAGQSVDLDQTHLGGGGDTKSMLLTWSDEPNSRMQEDDERRVYSAGTDWRIVGTYNNVDRGRVFPMGSALTRRWAIVPVPPIGPDDFEELLINLDCREPVAGKLKDVYRMHLDRLPIGPAPFIDMARYVALEDPSPTDNFVTTWETVLLQDAYLIYMGQQMVRLDPDERNEFLRDLEDILGARLAREVDSL